jgi:transposase-like protein
MDKESLRLLLAQGVSVEKIAERFARHPSTVAYWMRKHGLEAPNRAKHAAKGGIDRDVLEAYVEGGMTIAELAEAVGQSRTAVRYWLGRYGLKTQRARRADVREQTRTAREEGQNTNTRDCRHHGSTTFVIDATGRYRCRRCRSAAVSRRRRHVKRILVAEAGGCCRLCGYDRHPAALAFHHLDPARKRFIVSAWGISLGLDRLREEARKCVLLCANCHAEVECGVAEVSIDSA